MLILANIFMCTCGILMCFSSSPVQSVIFLILSFCCAAIVLFMFHVEFIGLLFIIIYVGAIAVLFLFVIMMLNVKNNIPEEIKNFSSKNLRVVKFIQWFISLIVVFFCFIVFNKLSPYVINPFFFNFKDDSLIYFVDKISNIEVIGQILFNNYLICVLLAGIILLVALVGAIILTLKFNKIEKKQNANRQLARNEDFITFFK